jgi:hypothetical protein
LISGTSTSTSTWCRSGGNLIYLGGRALHVMRAVEREEAQRLGGRGPDGQAAHKDKRNVYLANEGLLVSCCSLLPLRKDWTMHTAF